MGAFDRSLNEITLKTGIRLALPEIGVVSKPIYSGNSINGEKMFKKKTSVLLAIDAVVNLLLGVLLLLFPAGIIGLLGLPPSNTFFYATIMGSVIFGIGIALCIEWLGAPHSFRRLGLGGAIAINFCGAGVLLVWLLFGGLDIPLRGQIILWSVDLVVLGIGMAEVMTRSWKYDNGDPS